MRGHGVVHLEPDHTPKRRCRTPSSIAPAIVGFQFLDLHVGVAGDVERMRLHNLHARETVPRRLAAISLPARRMTVP